MARILSALLQDCCASTRLTASRSARLRSASAVCLWTCTYSSRATVAQISRAHAHALCHQRASFVLLRANGFDRSLRMRCTVSVQMSSDSSVGALKMRLQTLSGGWCGVSFIRRVVRQPQHYPMRLALRSDSTFHTSQFTEISSARSSLGWLRFLMRFASSNRHQVCD